MGHATWVHRVARVLVRPLVGTAVAPSHVTTLRLVTGLAAAAAFAVGARGWDVTGGWLFVLSALLDRADGELARLTGTISAAGARYDDACDTVCNVLAFGAIGVGLARGALGPAALLMGAVAAVSIAASFALAVRLERSGAGLPSASGFDADDALFIVGPAAWFGALAPLLVAATIGAPLFLLYLGWRHRGARWRSPQ